MCVFFRFGRLVFEWFGHFLFRHTLCAYSIIYTSACMYDHLRFYFVNSARSLYFILYVLLAYNQLQYTNIHDITVLWDAKSSMYNTLKKFSHSHSHSLHISHVCSLHIHFFEHFLYKSVCHKFSLAFWVQHRTEKHRYHYCEKKHTRQIFDTFSDTFNRWDMFNTFDRISNATLMEHDMTLYIYIHNVQIFNFTSFIF